MLHDEQDVATAEAATEMPCIACVMRLRIFELTLGPDMRATGPRNLPIFVKTLSLCTPTYEDASCQGLTLAMQGDVWVERSEET